jgi:sigma-B regulation protein RsbU (phosphoserine phosphatase)
MSGHSVEEVTLLKRRLAAFQAQSKLIERFLTLAHSSAEEPMLHKILRETLQISADLVSAEKGSLFLLDSHGRVSDSILTRGDRPPKESAAIIADVMSTGLAAWVKTNQRIGLVMDTQNDSRWLDLPNQPYDVRSALSVPILRGGNLLGLVTLLHSEPHRFNQESADLMELTAALIGVALENAQMYEMLQQYSQALDSEMDKARRIQQQFLPTKLPQIAGWEVAASFHPARKVSGDFYDAFTLPNGRMCIVLGDVCDKGVGAALFMALIRSLIRVLFGKACGEARAAAADACTPDDLDALAACNAVTGTNDYLASEHSDSGMFASLFVGVLNTGDGRLAYVNAGHEAPLIVSRDGIRQKMKATAPVVGAIPEARFEAQTVVIGEDETLVVYSDGVTEAMSPEKEFFGRDKFNLSACRVSVSASALIAALEEELFTHIRNASQHDDITIVAVHRRGD